METITVRDLMCAPFSYVGKCGNKEPAVQDGGQETTQTREMEENTAAMQSDDDRTSSTDDQAEGEEEEEIFVAGKLVSVKEADGAGKRRLSGVGKVISFDAEAGTYDVKFTMGGRDKSVARSLVKAYDMFGDIAMIAEATRESIGETCGISRSVKGLDEMRNEDEDDDDNDRQQRQERGENEGAAEMANDLWVRRSYRCKGKNKLHQPRLRDLLTTLYKNDPEDQSVAVLRIKNYVDADVNKQLLMEILDALKNNTVVQALYIQNMEEGFDDDVLERLTQILQQNSTIWALNVGENFKVSRNGWERFAQELAKTHVTHMYAGSETTVYGKLKVQMRDVIRNNRVKHTRHKDPDNIAVIRQIGQMWWNPKNAGCLQGALTEDERRAMKTTILPWVGRRLAITMDKEKPLRLARIAKYDDKTNMHLLAWMDCADKAGATVTEKGEWVSIMQCPHVLSQGIKWAKRCDEEKNVPVKSVVSRPEPKKKKMKVTKAPKPPTVKELCQPIYDTITELYACRPFINKFNWRRENCPGYPDIVKTPMDFRTVRRSLERGKFESINDFANDVRLIFNNCINYYDISNEDENPVTPLRKWASELLETFDKEFAKIGDHQKDENDCYRDKEARKEESTETEKTDEKKQDEEEEEEERVPTDVWEPVQVFTHGKFKMKEEIKREKRGQSYVRFFKTPQEWAWIPNDKLFKWEEVCKLSPKELNASDDSSPKKKRKLCADDIPDASTLDKELLNVVNAELSIFQFTKQN